jgi:hypothetical protein
MVERSGITEEFLVVNTEASKVKRSGLTDRGFRSREVRG